jgi:methyl-accepting chemotaxis protein
MVLLAVLSASCMETGPSTSSAAGSKDSVQSPDPTNVARTSGDWSIDDVEAGTRPTVGVYSPNSPWNSDVVGELFTLQSDSVPALLVAQSNSSTLSSTSVPTTTHAAVREVISIETRPSPKNPQVVTKARPVVASKMTESQIAAYLASLKMCQPPFPAKATTVVAGSPHTPSTPVPSTIASNLTWTRGGFRVRPTADLEPDQAATTEPVAVAAHTSGPTPTTTPVAATQPPTAVALPPIHIPAIRPIWAGLLGIGLGLAALGAGLATVGLGAVHARSKDRAGNTHRSLTLHARLTFAFGAMATLGLTACALAAGLMVVSVSGAIQIGACAVVSIAAPIGLWLWIRNAVVEPLARATESVNAMASGDFLRQPLNSTSRDECGELSRGIDRLAATVRDAFTEVAINSTAVNGAATQIASGAQQMSEAVGIVIKRCSEAAETATEANRVVTDGQVSIRKTVDDIRLVDQIISGQSESVHAIQSRTGRVGRLVQLIEDLADRAHLNALNASVEASRAGAAGTVFGQLAEESRRVAERAQNTLAEAARMVEALEDDARAAGEKATETVHHSRHGAQLAANAHDDLDRIAGRTEDVAGTTRTAARTAEEAGADAAQSAAIAAQLAGRSGDILAVIGRFKLGTEKLIRQGPPAPLASPASHS